MCSYGLIFLLAQKPQSVTKDERIAALEAEMAALNAKTMTTSAQSYGLPRKDGRPLEMFT